MKALSIWQPWASLIIHGGKDVENRPWRTSYRGELLIHASAHKPTRREQVAFADFVCDRLGFDSHVFKLAAAARRTRGGIIGVATLVDCVRDYASVWAAPGQWHWVLRDSRPLVFQPLRGARGVFDVPQRVNDGPALALNTQGHQSPSAMSHQVCKSLESQPQPNPPKSHQTPTISQGCAAPNTPKSQGKRGPNAGCVSPCISRD